MQVATLFRESTSLLGSSAGMEAGAAATTNTTVTSSGSSSSVASPPEPGSAIPIADTAPTGLSVLTTPLMSATSTPPPPPISSSPPLPTVVSSPTASTSSSSSSSSASSSSSSSASSASSCTPPNSNCSSGPTTTTSTPSSAPPPPPPPSSPPTTPTLEAASEQQHSQEQQIEQPSPLSPPQQEQQPIMSQPEERDACHPHDTCHDACHDACHDSSAVPLNLCPTSLSVHVGYDFATNNPNHPANYSNKYKMNMKLEREDDGYETANSLPPRGVTAEGGGSSGGGEIKCEKLDDPYSFIDDDPMPIMTSNGSEGVLPPHPIHMQQQPPLHHQQQQQHSIHGQHQMSGMGEGGGIGSTGSDGSDMLGTGGQPPYAIDSGLSYHYHIAIGPKKRGRKKKVKSDEPEFTTDPNGATLPRPPKERKKHDRFNGMPEEEVSKRTLPDHITSNLDIIIIGINPGLFAAYKGHHYAGPGNHFWKCLYLSGLTQQQMSADEDYKLLQVGIGFTNMVARATKGSADLTRKEIKDGSQILLEKIKKYQPKIAVFNGKLIYEVFSGKKDFNFGRQPDLVEGTNTYMWVMPSSSARCAQLPRAADKVPFYAALKKFRDYLNGLVASIDDAELVFTEPRVKSCYEAEPRGDPLLFPSEPLTDVGDDSAIINRDEDGSVVNSSSGVAGVGSVQGLLPNKKKRGRPKKVKVEGGGEDGGGSGAAPVVKPAAQPRRNNNSTNNANNANNCDFPKKKRGRPKKVKVALTDEETDINISANLLRNSGGSDLNSHGVQLGMGVGALSGHHPMLHASPLALDNGTNNNHLSTKCFSSPSPIQSPPPHHFYHHHQQQQQQQQHHPHLQHHHQQQQQQLYGGVGGYCLSPRPSHPHTPVQLYSSAVHTTPNHNSSNSSQSPRPQSQPFTHSDLSSEISAAISSSEQLGSPPPSPGMIGAPDFEPPTNMAEDDGGGGSSSVHGDSGSGGPGGASSSGNGPGSSGGECCRLSPATTPNSVPVEQQQHYSGYHTAYGHHHHHQQQQQFHVGAGMDHPGPSSSVGVSVPPPPAPSTPEHHQQQQQQSPQPQVAHQQHTQDIAAKSLSGLESLVDQIPSITDGEATVLNEPTDYSTHQFAHGHGHQYSGTMSRAATGSPVSDMGVGAATLYGYGSGGSGTVAGAVSSYHHHPHQHLPAALYPTPSWATASSYDSPHVPLPYQPSVYGHGPPPVGVGVPPPPPHHHQGAYGAPGAAGIHVPSPNYPSPYYGYPPQTHHHHGYHHHHHHPSYLGGF